MSDNELIPDKNVKVNGQLFGAASTIKLSIKTAFWIITTTFIMISSIFAKSYFKLKSDTNTNFVEFVESVNTKLDKIGNDVTNIRIENASIKGEIKMILDRQNRQNPVQPTTTYISTSPPPSFNNEESN